MIQCVCESCKTPVEVPDNYAGSRIACKSCKAIMRVPLADSTNGASAAPKQLAPAAAAPKAPAPKPAPQPQAKAPAAPQPPAKPAPAVPSPAAKAPAAKPAAPAQPPAKAPAPPLKSPAVAAPQPPAKAAQPQPKAPAPAPQPSAKAPPPKPAAAPPKAPAPETPLEPTAMLVMVEAVQFSCSHCANVLQAWPEQVGMAMNCPYCQAALTVPTPAPPQLQARPAPVKSAGSHPNVPVKFAGSHPNVPVKSAGSHPKAPAAAPKAPQPPAKGAAPKKVGFRFPCEKCKAMIQADSSHIGLMIVCPQCKHDMTVPEPS